MKRKNVCVLMVLGFFISFPVFAGPFGIEMGMTLVEVKNICETSPVNGQENVYVIIPPKPHKMFETYVIKISPTYGLFYIKGIGKDISTSTYGTELKSTFTSLVTSLETGYGSATVYDFLRSGSIWDEPRDWMMGLRKQERMLVALWEKKTDGLFTGNIETLGLMAFASNSETGYLLLEYYSKDSEAAKAEAKAVTDSVF